jgi:hypothetical protein
MRVSSTFKALVRSSLYDKLEWKDWEKGHWPVATESKDFRGRIVRVESDDMDLRLIKTIEIQQHTLEECPRSLGKVYRRQHIILDVLRVTTLRKQLLDRVQRSSRAICLHGASCPLIGEVSPRKIVVITDEQTPIPTLHFGRIDTSRLESYVVHLRFDPFRILPVPSLPLDCQSKRLTIVLIPPKHYTGSYNDDYDMTLYSLLCIILDRCGPSSHARQIVSEIVLVNFNVLRDPKPNGRFGSLQDMWSMCLRDERIAVSRSGPVTFTPITMSEYLSNYDWSGEFTEEEAARLLVQDAEIKRVALGREVAEALVE